MHFLWLKYDKYEIKLQNRKPTHPNHKKTFTTQIYITVTLIIIKLETIMSE